MHTTGGIEMEGSSYLVILKLGDRIIESVGDYSIEFCDDPEGSDIAYKADPEDTKQQVANGMHYINVAIKDLGKMGIVPKIEILRYEPSSVTISRSDINVISDYEDIEALFNSNSK